MSSSGRIEESEEEDNDNPVEVIPTVPAGASMHQRNSWNKEEDKILISGWLNVNKDELIGTDKKKISFWQRIADYYNESRDSGPRRSATQCKAHWHKLSAAVAKFVGCYEQANQQRRSGESECDVFMAAHGIYRTDLKKNFTFEHAWRLLRSEPKWIDSYQPSPASDSGSSKRTKINERGGYSSASNTETPTNEGVEFETDVRPRGVKVAKTKGKASAQRETEELFQELSVRKEREVDKVEVMRSYVKLKKKEIEAKEKVAKAKENTAKYNMLMQLMQKDSLSAEQKVMYNKLYADLFGS
ncbi:hypothetical protein Ancab_040627 [Ancistrocladus abbreviatus]